MANLVQALLGTYQRLGRTAIIGALEVATDPAQRAGVPLCLDGAK
jgi:hypothetical protein